jgi:5'-nucleotidase
VLVSLTAMQLRWVLVATLATLLGGMACQPSPPNALAPSARRVTLLHTNDGHSRLVPFTPEGGVEVGGVVARKAVIDAVRHAGGPVFVFDAGDYAQGLVVYDVWQGSAEVMAMNASSYDAITLGNHQFDLGGASLARSLAGGTLPVLGKDRHVPAAAMPVVVSNMDFSGDPALRAVVRPRAVVERGGVRVGVVGAMTEALPSIVVLPPTIRMKPTVASVQEQIDALTREGIDTIVLLSHRGTKADLELVPKLTGVDVVVSGHDHAFLGDRARLGKAGLGPRAGAKVEQPYPVVAKAKDGRTVLVVSAGEFGQVVGRLDVELDAQGAVVAWQGEPIVVRCQPPQQPCEHEGALARDLADYLRPVASASERTVTTLPRALPPSADEESELGTRMADAMLRAAAPFGATMAIAEGDFRAGLSAGVVTYGDVYATWPFGLHVVVVELSGAALTGVIERWLKADDPPPQVAGLTIAYTRAAGAPHGSATLGAILAGSARLVPDQKYKVAVDEYMAHLAGDPAIVQACASGACVDTPIVQREALVDELARPTPAAPAKPRLVRQ